MGGGGMGSHAFHSHKPHSALRGAFLLTRMQYEKKEWFGKEISPRIPSYILTRAHMCVPLY